ncbi:MAG: ATP-binding cassette domain-containing protein, partial [Comamonadaceae bacterium]
MTADAVENVVEIRKLWTVFESPDGDQVVHRDLDLSIRRGEVLSLVGGSGTGKTVLLRQILGLEQPTRGEVRVLGQPPGQLSAMAAANVGMLFQHGALFSAFSVLDNIAFPLRELKLLRFEADHLQLDQRRIADEVVRQQLEFTQGERDVVEHA